MQILEKYAMKFFLIALLFSFAAQAATKAQSDEAEMDVTDTGQSESADELANRPDGALSLENPGPGSLSRFPVHLSLSMKEGYDDNARAGRDSEGSPFTNGSLKLSYDLREKPTRITATTDVGGTYFSGDTGGKRSNVITHFDLVLRHEISTRLKLGADVYAAYRTEPDFSSDVGVENQRGNYFHTRDSVFVDYEWVKRFSTVTRYKFRLIQYDDSSLTSLNRVENTIGEEAKFHLVERTALVGEYRFGIIDYENMPIRDSTTNYALAGVNHDFTPSCNAVLRAGAALRSYDEGGTRLNPHFESSFSYSGAHHSVLSWTTRYGVEEPNVATALSRTTFRTGLNLAYSLTSRVSSNVTVYYRHDINQSLPSPGVDSADFSTDTWNASFSVRYAIYRHFNLDVGFIRTQIDSSDSMRNFSRNRYYAGLNFTY